MLAACKCTRKPCMFRILQNTTSCGLSVLSCRGSHSSTAAEPAAPPGGPPRILQNTPRECSCSTLRTTTLARESVTCHALKVPTYACYACPCYCSPTLGMNDLGWAGGQEGGRCLKCTEATGRRRRRRRRRRRSDIDLGVIEPTFLATFFKGRVCRSRRCLKTAVTAATSVQDPCMYVDYCRIYNKAVRGSSE